MTEEETDQLEAFVVAALKKIIAQPANSSTYIQLDALRELLGVVYNTKSQRLF